MSMEVSRHPRAMPPPCDIADKDRRRTTISLEAAQKASERLMQWGHHARLKQQQVALEQRDASLLEPRFAQRLSKAQIAAAAERLSTQWPHGASSQLMSTSMQKEQEDMGECTFRPQQIAKTESWITSRYQYPPTVPQPRVSSRDHPLVPRINQFPIQHDEKDVFVRLHNDFLRQDDKRRAIRMESQRQLRPTKVVDHDDVDAFLKRQAQYEESRQLHLDQRNVPDPECKFAPELNDHSRQLCASARTLDARLHKACERRKSKLEHSLAMDVAKAAAPRRRRTMTELEPRLAQLSRPKPAAVAVPSDFQPQVESQRPSVIDLHDVQVFYAKQQTMLKSKKDRMVRHQLTSILDEYRSMETQATDTSSRRRSPSSGMAAAPA